MRHRLTHSRDNALDTYYPMADRWHHGRQSTCYWRQDMHEPTLYSKVRSQILHSECEQDREAGKEER
jgi:hypothetical protein